MMAWLSGCIALQAQSPAMLHFEVEDGLPGNLVYCAMEDQQGYLWFGTDKGLSRFDGQSFFNYGTKEGLPDPEVINLYQDAAGRLWIACFKQKPVYRLEGRFISAQEDTLLNRLMMKNAGYIFSETADSTLWIVSGGVISQKNGIQKQYPLKNIGAVAEIQGDFLGLNGSQIFHISGKDQPLQTKSEAIWTHKKWASSYTQNGNRFLFAFPDLTLLLEYREGQIVEVQRTESVFQTVYTDRLGRFWGASPGKGAVCFENDQRDLSQPVWYLPGKKISGIYHDLQGNFWFLSAGEGIFLRPNRQAWRWDKPSGLPSSNLLTLQMAFNGVLLAGDDLGNVHRISSGKFLGTQSFGGADGTNFIRQILPLEPNTFWVTSDEGFFNEHKTSHPTLWQSENGTISAGAPKSMASAGDRLWFGSSQGLATWEPRKEKMPKLLKKGRVTTIALDNEQQLWVGGIEGLFSNYQGFGFNWGDRFEALKQRIVALVPGRGARLWAITPQSGLLELEVSGEKVQSVKVIN